MREKYTHIRRSIASEEEKLAAVKGILECIYAAESAGQIRPYAADASQGFRSAMLAQAATICEVEDDHGRSACGYSFCGPRDNFSRARGRQIARGRALRELAKMLAGKK